MNTEAQATPVAAPTVKIAAKKSESPLDKILGLLSSVRFGLVMLGLLLSCCIIGMIVMQVNVEGVQKYYHQTITPAQRLIFGALGFFDIYHARYFTLFLAITGLNIILASIDRFPAAWQYVIKPKLTASPKFIAAQMFVSESEEREKPQAMAEQVRAAWRKLGYRARINEENNRITVFAQRSVWNRLGAYVVHVALLTIFTGGFLTNRYGLGGSMEIRPGKSSNQFITIKDDFTGPVEGAAKLPFDIECRDIQQKLIRPEGGLEAQNTIDWLSSITIKDGDVRKDLLVHLNNVGDYRGYRFFQSQF
ncbi:MAG TPA: cytochrome c biogenesis protein ResB, partial [Blastocatellia bacterium]|nr:cytochrome c biogenesis protein ResB [Blastocatellia bacterium]